MSAPYTSDELTDILERALAAMESGLYDHVYRRPDEPWHMERDLDRLNACCPKYKLSEEVDYWDTVQDCLTIALSAPESAYKKPEEPICSHKEALELEMYAFVVQHPHFSRPIYTKFCLKEKPDGTWYISIDCHT